MIFPFIVPLSFWLVHVLHFLCLLAKSKIIQYLSTPPGPLDPGQPVPQIALPFESVLNAQRALLTLLAEAFEITMRAQRP